MNPTRRQMLAVSAGALVASSLVGDEPKPSKMGVVIHSYGNRQSASRTAREQPSFDDPLVFLGHARKIGAGGVQVGIGVRDRDYLKKLRQTAEDAARYVEGIVRLPLNEKDVERFAEELRCAKEVGVKVLRTVCLSGRRYETFETARAFDEFAKQSTERLGLAAKAAATAGVALAVENHKDWRADQLVDLLKKLASEHLGVCVDTGNSIALLEDAQAVVETLAPLALTTHFKDMAVAEYADGFLLAEVPLGKGFLDLKKIIATLRKHRPAIRLNLEMITRDPLKVPCLTAKYWATFESLPGRHLADALARVRQHAAKDLPEVSQLPRDKRVEVEEENVRLSLKFAAERLGG